jgi:hypothetical protein
MIRSLSVAAGAALVAVAACSSSSHTTLPPAPTSSTASTARPDPRFDIVLDDAGLELPPGPTPGGIYLVSFEDRRTRKPANQLAQVRFRPTGPPIVLEEVSAGTSKDVIFAPNLEAYLAIDDNDSSLPMPNQLEITPTPGYSTPVT